MKILGFLIGRNGVCYNGKRTNIEVRFLIAYTTNGF